MIESKNHLTKMNTEKIQINWQTVKLSDVMNLMGGNAFKSKDSVSEGIKWLKIANVGIGKPSWNETSYLPTSFRDNFKNFLLYSGDVVMALTRPILNGKLKVARLGTKDTPALLNQRVGKVLPIGNNSLEYLYYLISYKSTVASIQNVIAGTDPPNISLKDIENIVVTIPKDTTEQRKIADILLTWDKAIELKQQLIDLKKEQKIGLMQKLLTGEVRLPGFEEEWELIKLKDFLEEKNVKTTENNQHEILSVTKDGIVSQNEHFKKQVASKNNIGYKILNKNELVFSAMNLWMGSLDVLTSREIGIVSPAYKTFVFNSSLMLSSFGKYFMKSSFMIWIYIVNSEQGASVVRRNLDLKGLLSSKVKVPSVSEQREIAKILSSLDNQLELLKKELIFLQEQKKGLMQQLLTGKTRVKV